MRKINIAMILAEEYLLLIINREITLYFPLVPFSAKKIILKIDAFLDYLHSKKKY